MYKFLFGPVPSLKLGISPDIDLVPHKICSLNCICCEYGRRSKLITKRKEYVVLAEVIKKIADFSSKKQLLISIPTKTILRKSAGNIIDMIKMINHVNSLEIKNRNANHRKSN